MGKLTRFSPEVRERANASLRLPHGIGVGHEQRRFVFHAFESSRYPPGRRENPRNKSRNPAPPPSRLSLKTPT